MQRAVESAAPVESFASAFEHSITWEDDIWSADPVDVARIYDPEMIPDRKVYTADAWTRNQTLTLYPDAATNSLSTAPPATNVVGEIISSASTL